jgi:hypothetical protein
MTHHRKKGTQFTSPFVDLKPLHEGKVHPLLNAATEDNARQSGRSLLAKHGNEAVGRWIHKGKVLERATE